MTIVVLNGELKGKMLSVAEKTQYGVIVENPTTRKAVLIEPCDFTSVENVLYKIKFFNLTTLRKKGFYFKNGTLTIDEYPRLSLIGRMLNMIDSTIEVVAETRDEIIIYVYDKAFFIPKSMKGKLYKTIK